jgi:hypothetical protein
MKGPAVTLQTCIREVPRSSRDTAILGELFSLLPLFWKKNEKEAYEITLLPVCLCPLPKFLAYFIYFKNNRVGLWDHVSVCVCVYVYPPH